MRALTVRQPWAWAIVHGGKDVENRTTAWSYRGPLAIHAAATISRRGMVSELVGQALWDRGHTSGPINPFVPDPFGVAVHLRAVLGVVELAGIHHAHKGCCDSPWAEQEYSEAGGRIRHDLVHLELENPRPLRAPAPADGHLGLWAPDPDLLDRIQEQLR